MSLLVLFAFALDLPDELVGELQCLYFVHIVLSLGPPYELVDGHQYHVLVHLSFSLGLLCELVDGQHCLVLAPAVFLLGHGEHLDGLLRHVLAFFALDVLVSHAVLFGSSFVSA